MCYCPPIPNVPNGIVRIIFYGILVNFLIVAIKGLYLIGPANVNIRKITDCSGFEETQLSTQFNITKIEDGPGQTLSGKIDLGFDITPNILMTVRGMRLQAEHWEVDKIFVYERSVCKILDNYVWEMSDFLRKHNISSVCPIGKGIYQLKNFNPNFSKIQFPVEMFGEVKFQIELMDTDDVKLACKEFELENSLIDTSLDE